MSLLPWYPEQNDDWLIKIKTPLPTRRKGTEIGTSVFQSSRTAGESLQSRSGVSIQSAKSSIGDPEEMTISASHRAVIESLRIEPSIDQVARLADCCRKSPGRRRFGSRCWACCRTSMRCIADPTPQSSVLFLGKCVKSWEKASTPATRIR